ncbi:hypothetical protein LCGC14_1488070 [marine sediment metagenome]|uniref:Type-F conjugative transfer system pilin assembly protein TrbC n=1 Tax=marine sediment metagenome TaxID=412755 RepID=A0A0F9JTE4_9ZZZZ
MRKINFLFLFLMMSNLYAVDFPISTEKRACNNCRSFEKNSGDNQSAVYIFISFSVPENTWLELDRTTSPINKIFVVRGIPNNSFEVFGKKIAALKDKGFSSFLEINPELFHKYEIINVPSFVVTNGGNFNKVSGNISLQKTLEIIEKKD